MKFVFAHDHFFKEGKGGFYSSGSFPASIWSRYLKICDELTVVGRDGGMVRDDELGLARSSTAGVTFELVPNLSNLRSLVLGNKAARCRCRHIVSNSDAVIARLPSRVGSLFVQEAIRQRKPYAVEVVGDPRESLKYHGSLQAKLYSVLAASNLRKMVRNSPFSIYVTEQYLQNLYPNKSGFTESCSDVEIAPVDEYVLQRRLDQIERHVDKIIFGLIGNFSASYKGIDVAIRSLGQIGSELPDWEFQVVGSGDPSSYVSISKALGISEKVKFVGSLPSGVAVFDWLDKVDIYLQPSLTEGLPRTLVEAMSRGCPAIASNVGGIPELLMKEQMVPPGDYKKLADNILGLVKNRSAQRKLAIQNFEKSKSFYSGVLEERRSNFWRAFRKYVEEIRG
ncbi:glycosyltransferase family 4 protein [Idiomarina sp.]|uniref:glycosyltransferase family 4 protein n=1 Tax=Idiomarina sp. TaxID=1874361 RepID=UPI003518715C